MTRCNRTLAAAFLVTLGLSTSCASLRYEMVTAERYKAYLLQSDDGYFHLAKEVWGCRGVTYGWFTINEGQVAVSILAKEQTRVRKIVSPAEIEALRLRFQRYNRGRRGKEQ